MRFFTTVAPFVLAFVNVMAADNLTAYGICQTGCNEVAIACYKTAGFTFGTVVASNVTTPPTILACNSALGECSTACANSTGLVAPAS